MRKPLGRVRSLTEFLSRNECNGSRKSLCQPVLCICICVNINSKLVTLFFSQRVTKILGPPKNAWDPNLAEHAGPRTQIEKS